MNICDRMLLHAEEKIKSKGLFAPALRRQIAGELYNPYDLTNFDNRDIKLYCENYKETYGTNPPSQNISKIAVFSADENMTFLLKVSKL
jgi:hypothetical protein